VGGGGAVEASENAALKWGQLEDQGFFTKSSFFNYWGTSSVVNGGRAWLEKGASLGKKP